MIPETMERIKNSERAVSPVIGVILMVAITVILAAVIAAFVLGFGADQDSAPQASWGVSVDTDADTITFTHEGGDSVDRSQLAIMHPNDTAILEVGDADGTMTAGSSISTSGLNETGQYRLIWHQDGGDDTSVLRSYNHN